MHTPLYDTKNIKKNADIMQVHFRNHSCTRNIYNKLPNTKQNWGAHCVKLTNTPLKIWIHLLLPLAQPPLYL